MPSDYPNAGLLRRFAAMCYDAFLIIALWMTSTTIIVSTLTDGEPAGGPGYQFFLYLELAIFYIYFWRATGQTLGMQVWRIRLVDETGSKPDVTDCIMRFAVATLSTLAVGLGFIWALFNRERLTLHDIASKTRVEFIGKPGDEKDVPKDEH